MDREEVKPMEALPLSVGFAVEYLDGVMEAELAEIGEQWRRVREHVMSNTRATPARCDALTDALRQYAQDLRRNPSGGDDYPFEIMKAVANRIDEMLAASPPSAGREGRLDQCTRPHLGLATTRDLLAELSTRFEIHAAGGLDYRTVDGEEIAARGRLVSSAEHNNGADTWSR